MHAGKDGVQDVDRKKLPSLQLGDHFPPSRVAITEISVGISVFECKVTIRICVYQSIIMGFRSN